MTSLHGRHGPKKARRATLAPTAAAAPSNGKSSVTSEYDDDEGEQDDALLARLEPISRGCCGCSLSTGCRSSTSTR